MAAPQTLIVYSPEGQAERHTVPNARDLVNGAGYTWVKGSATTPASFAPVRPAVPRGQAAEAALAQSVLDSVGGVAGRATTAAAQNIMDEMAAEGDIVETPVEEEVADFSNVAVETGPVRDDEPTPAPAARRGRGKGALSAMAFYALGAFETTTAVDVSTAVVSFSAPALYARTYFLRTERAIHLSRLSDASSADLKLAADDTATIELNQGDALSFILADGETDGKVFITAL